MNSIWNNLRFSLIFMFIIGMPALAQSGSVPRIISSPQPYNALEDQYYAHSGLRERAFFMPCTTMNIALPSLMYSAISIANPLSLCNEWMGVLRGINITNGAINLDGNALPAVMYSSTYFMADESNLIGTIYIKVVGGPGGVIAPQEDDIIYTRLLGGRDILISIGYTGTLYGTRFPNPDFKLACEDIATYTKIIRARNPFAKIILIGESLGGVIATQALRAPFDGVADKLILVGPLLYSPHEAEYNFAHNFHLSPETDSKLNVRILSGPSLNFDAGDFKSVYTFDLVKHLFERDEEDTELSARLRDVCSLRRVLLIYGDKDNVIGIEKIKRDRGDECVSYVRIEGMGHRIDDHRTAQKFFDLITDAMVRFERAGDVEEKK